MVKVRYSVRRSACGFTPCVPPTLDPREQPGALAAHAGICGGRGEILVPTATLGGIGAATHLRV
jgi:hypothetical protein